MITVFILASRQEERYVGEFWKHLSVMRRVVQGITWAHPLYVEDMPKETNAIVQALPNRYIVIGCLSNCFLSEILDQPSLREMIEGAALRIPFVICSCQWDQYPSPFQGKMPLISGAISAAPRRDQAFVDAVERLRSTMKAIK